MLLAFAACHPPVRTPLRDSLVGVKAPLLPSPSLALVLPGRVGDRPAAVFLDSTARLPRVTTSCFDEPLMGGGRAVLVDPLEGSTERPLTRLDDFTLADERLRTFRAALVEGPTCEVFLGGALLDGVAFEVDALAREVRFVPSRPLAEWRKLAEASADALWVLELTREPRHDWPMLPVRLSQGEASLTAPFVLSTAALQSTLLASRAEAAGLTRASALLADRPELGREARAALDAVLVPVVELSPGLRAPPSRFELIRGAAASGLAGALGVDAWPAGDVTVDLTGGVFAIRRPRTFVEPGRGTRCSRGGPSSEERCFELQVLRAKAGLVLSARVWSVPERGLAVLLDLDGVSSAECRVGLSVPAHKAGVSTQHLLPWPSLAKSQPGCRQALAKATGARFGALSDGPAPCPQLGVFVAEPSRAQLTCEGGRGLTGASGLSEATVLDWLEKDLREAAPPPEEEPPDPE